MIPKFAYILLFLGLSVCHICAHLRPIIEAKVSIIPISLQLSRKLNISVGYEYHQTMLWVAIVNSMLMVFGFWRCQHEADKALHQKHNIGANKKLTAAAAKVKPICQSKTPSSWQLFPLRYFVLCAVPWLTTLLLNLILNYSQLNMVLGHFCTSPWEVLALYGRVQMLYLQRLLASIAAPSSGTFKSIFAAHTGQFTFENNLLVGED
ncbi:uncharacterized protein LOC6557870 [Drosophila grimshawi]|uniref:GH14944 n=1 Tax=Drosophila grimshawi TaxID=7222 RepID=B4J1L2_DROGR|nr:uncharacterized protein LOC6557870 [Drosophila grimshawi]EDV96932.1 GH14944 [Drosophila grimshawi]